MTRLQLTAPAVEPITLAEAKAHLRVETTHEDELIQDLIKAARQEAERQTSICMIRQDWRLFLDYWPDHGMIEVPIRPLVSVEEIRIFDAQGTAQILGSDAYMVDIYATLPRIYAIAMPSAQQLLNGIEIDMRCGFGEAGADVPDLLKRAILVLVAHWFEFRGTYSPKDQPVSIPPLFDRLIASERVVRI